MQKLVSEQGKLEARYFDRMAASLGDKARLLDWLPTSGKVLDVGAGGGELVNAMAARGYEAVGLDKSSDSVAREKAIFPNCKFIQGSAAEATLAGVGEFDAITCSSLMHEVYAFGDGGFDPGDTRSLSAALKAYHEVLKPGGRLLMRDGVLPTAYDSNVILQLATNKDVEALELYLSMSPFVNTLTTPQGRHIGLVKLAEQSYSGTLQAAMEFAYTYTWGVDSFHRETQELYGLMSLEAYGDFIEANGFSLLHSEEYFQEGYRMRLESKLSIERDGAPVWPSTNAIWIAERK